MRQFNQTNQVKIIQNHYSFLKNQRFPTRILKQEWNTPKNIKILPTNQYNKQKKQETEQTLWSAIRKNTEKPDSDLCK